jgi:sulfate permease, SulP family
MSPARLPGPLGRLLPPWARSYQRAWLGPDVTAGLTLTVMLVPQAMAYASLAGMPPITGLYASVVALGLYAWLGSSSHVSFGPFALVSLLTAAALEPLTTESSPRAIALAGTLAILVGLVHLALALARADAVVVLISRPVVVGFTAGVAVIIALSQVRDLFGVDAPRSARFVEATRIAIEAVPRAHLPTVTIGAVSLVLLLLGRRYLPRVPVTLLVSVAGILVVVSLDLVASGVPVVGSIPSGLPRPTVPDVSLADVARLFPSAVVIALIAYGGNVSIAKAIAERSREVVDPNRELVASGAANLGAGLVTGFPVAASFTRTAVVYEARARTQLAGVVAAVALILVLVTLAPLLESLPRAVLAAIVLIAVLSLFDLAAVRSTFRVDRADGAVLVLTFVATLALGAELGFAVGVGGNVVVHVVRGMRPALIVLGRVQGTRLYRNVERYPTITDPSGVILRLDGPLDFLSVEQVTGRLRRLAAERPELSWLVLDASGVTGMDSSGVHALDDLQSHLAEAGVALHLATLHGPQRDVIRRAGLWDELVEGSCHADIGSALAVIGVPDDAPLRHPGPDEQAPADLL